MSVREKLEKLIQTELDPSCTRDTHPAIPKAFELLADEIDRVERLIAVKIEDGTKLIDQWTRT